MKKQYIIPALATINVETQAPMLFGSDTDTNKKNGGGSMGDFSGNQLSNEGEMTETSGSIWDEEE